VLVLLVLFKVRFLSPPYSNCPGSTCLTHVGTEGLALPGEITVAGRSLERLQQMPKQRLAELKLSGDLGDGEAGPADDGLDGASAFEVWELVPVFLQLSNRGSVLHIDA
jgi:hypothetical protein